MFVLLTSSPCSPLISSQALRTRLTALRDQNQYLSSQLKAVMKHSRVLEVHPSLFSVIDDAPQVEIDMAKQNIELYQLQEQATEDGSRVSTAPSSHQGSHRDHQSLSYSSDEEEALSVDKDMPQDDPSESALAKSFSAVALGNRPRVLTPNAMRRVQSVGPDSLLPLKHRENSPPLSPSRGSSSLRRTGRGGTGKGLRINNSSGETFHREIKSLQKQLDALLSSK